MTSGSAVLISTEPQAEQQQVKRQRRLARQEIQELLPRYAQATDLIAVDAGANEARVKSTYLEIFTEKAQIGVRGQMSVDGPLAWLEVVKVSTSSLRGSQHLIGSQVVEIEELPDPDGVGGRATMTSYLQATRVGADGELSRVLGTYFSTATHTPDSGWQLSALTLKLLALDLPQSGSSNQNP